MIVADLVAIILIIFSRHRNKLLMSLLTSVILTTVLFLYKPYEYVHHITVSSVAIIFVAIYICCLISYLVADKINPKRIIIYILCWEISYSILLIMIEVFNDITATCSGCG